VPNWTVICSGTTQVAAPEAAAGATGADGPAGDEAASGGCAAGGSVAEMLPSPPVGARAGAGRRASARRLLRASESPSSPLRCSTIATTRIPSLAIQWMRCSPIEGAHTSPSGVRICPWEFLLAKPEWCRATTSHWSL
jgi:hypothetical protein